MLCHGLGQDILDYVTKYACSKQVAVSVDQHCKVPCSPLPKVLIDKLRYIHMYLYKLTTHQWVSATEHTVHVQS